MSTTIQILDCTLRDGGFALEDANQKGWSFACFTKQNISDIIQDLEDTKIDIIELGSIEISAEDKRKYAIYQNIESISQTMPKKRSKTQMYAALFRGPDTPVEDIPEWNSNYCEAIRVIIRYSELKKSLDFCKELSNKGYKVFVQPMLTMRYVAEEIELLIKYANEMDAYALYIVDSYGYMNSSDIERLYRQFDKGLNPNIRIGFHAHNNMDLAYANAISFLVGRGDRNVIVDSCLMGIGQGAGNLQTEILINHMNSVYKTTYYYDAVLRGCERVDQFYKDGLWGYSVTRLLPAIHKTAYKYALTLRKTYNLSYVEINRVLKKMPENLRHRYTQENIIKLLVYNGYADLL